MHQPTRSTRGASSASTCSFLASPSCRGDVVDELEFAVRLQQAGVRADGVDVDPLMCSAAVMSMSGIAPGGQFDHQIVDGVAGAAFDDVEGQDVGAHRTERDGQRAEAARSVLQLDPQQIRRHAHTVSQRLRLSISGDERLREVSTPGQAGQLR